MALVNNDSVGPNEIKPDAGSDIASFIVERVAEWEDYRDANFQKVWLEYYRLWKCVYTAQDKTRSSERSKLISPALMQAIESAVAELQEATFGKGLWFDVVDDLKDPEKEDVQEIRRQLHEDFEIAKVPAAISEVFLNGAIYGTGIGKIIVEEITERTPTSRQRNDGYVEGGVEEKERIEVRLEAIDPKCFVNDPSARSIEEGFGCAHIIVAPKHGIVKKQELGIYRKGDFGSYTDDEDVASLGESKDRLTRDKVKLIEYAGLIPKRMLTQLAAADEAEEDIIDLFPEDKEADELYAEDLVEALITIANDNFVLKAVENPYMMQDRPFIAYQHDTVPNRFWGRGVAEKGYNVQKALDAELRARIDAMGLAAHPMMAIDTTRVPRGVRPEVMPGKTIFTNGNPNEILSPIKFPGADPASFPQAGELERMIQMATGSMDSAAPIGVSPRNNTATGMSMIQSGSIKRSKRTLENIGANFLNPFIKKAAWRYMQFNPERYPVKDYKFLPKTTLGIMAREYEQGQLTQLLSTTPPESPAYWLLLKGIYSNSSLENKDQMLQIIEQMMQKAMQPPEPDPLAIKQLQLEQQKIEAEVEVKKSSAILNMAKAEAEKAGIPVSVYLAKLQGLTATQGIEESQQPEQG